MTAAANIPADVKRVLDKRSVSRPNRVEKLAEGMIGLPLSAIVKNIDETTRSASFVFSTDDVDRSGDRVRTTGWRTDNHRRCPIVCWDHGKGPLGKIAIGKCEDPDGNYTVVIRPEDGLCIVRIYFSNEPLHDLAHLIWGLVKEGLIRAVSPGFMPVRARIMPGSDPSDEDPSIDYEEVDLGEISLTGVPDNPNALLISMTKALGGKRPSRELLSQFGILEQTEEDAVSQTSKPKLVVKSAKLNDLFATDLFAAALDKDGRQNLNKALAEWLNKSADDYLPLDDEGMVKSDGMTEGTGSDGGALVNKDAAAAPTDTPAEDVPSWKQPLEGPPGQAGAQDLYTRLMDFTEALEGWSARQDHPEFKKLIEEIAAVIDEKAKVLADWHDDEYPEHDAIAAGTEDQVVEKADESDESAESSGESDSEDETVEKSRRRMVTKSAARVRLEKRLKTLREKRAKMAKVIVKEVPGNGDDKALREKLATVEKERDRWRQAAEKAADVAEKFKKANDRLRNKSR